VPSRGPGAYLKSSHRRSPDCGILRTRWNVQVCAGWRSIDAEIGLPTLAMTNDTRLIRILSVDDHPLLRSGIAALIDTQPDMRMVGEASNGNEAVQLHRQLNPDVTLMDLQMPLHASSFSQRTRAMCSRNGL
jgi:hypothetical protein